MTTTQTLHYVDPPYIYETRNARNAGKTYRHEMTDEQHKDLADTLHDLTGMVIVSGYPSPLYEKLYANWQRWERASHADGARDRIEVLWINRPVQPSFEFIKRP